MNIQREILDQCARGIRNETWLGPRCGYGARGCAYEGDDYCYYVNDCFNAHWAVGVVSSVTAWTSFFGVFAGFLMRVKLFLLICCV